MNENGNKLSDDLEALAGDDFERELANGTGDQPKHSANPLENPSTTARPGQFDCERCAGKGKIRIYRRGGGWDQPGEVITCPVCRGKGSFVTSPESRRKNRQSAAKKKSDGAQEWRDAHPAEWALLKEAQGWTHQSDFLFSLYEQLADRGGLSDKQTECLTNKVAERAEKKAERAKPAAQVKGAGLSKLQEVFLKAIESGLKNPKLSIGSLAITRAKDHSKNPGHLYIKDHGEYAGKVSPDGEFFKGYNCAAETVALIKEIGTDPLAQAVEHGRKTGNCACCRRELTNKESVELGIGPICREKWGL